MKAKIQRLKKTGKLKIVIPKLPEAVEEAGIEIGNDKEHFKNPTFSFVDFGGVFSSLDSEGVDGNGKTYKFPGGSGFSFNWASEIGFGEFTVKRLTDGTMQVDSERLGKEFLKKALCALIDKAKDKSEKVH